jgi:histidinol phosphatase-like enzyme (inositol monophosphatase family)
MALAQPTTSAPVTPESLAAFAGTLADAARPLARRYFRSSLTVEDKADASPVTVADRSIEAELRRLIRSHHPDHGLYGEEEGADGADRDHTWVIDPIDGTRSFITGFPLFGTLIAHLHHGRPVFGMIDMPMLDERWTGGSGTASLLNGAVCRTSPVTRLADASLYSTSVDTFAGPEVAAFEAVSRRVKLRRFGGDCYIYGLLASGCIDLVIEAALQPYDFLPLVPIIEGAGGVITDWEGRALTLASGPKVVAAATPALHAEALTVLRTALG